MTLKLAGYEMAPKVRFQKDLMGYTQRLAKGGAVGQPPSPATPVYADEAGNHFMALPGEDNVAALPFIPGSPAQGDQGGFVPLSAMPQSSGSDGTSALMGGMTKAMPAATAVNWLGNAGASAMLGGSPGTGLATALNTLGVANPAMQGALGSALTTAAGAAGLGPMGGLLGGVMSGGGQGLMNAMGSQGLNSLFGATGLGRIPGASAAASMLSGQMGKLADMMTGGAWSGAMDKAAGVVDGLLSGKLPDVGSLGDFADPTKAAGSLGDINYGAIGAQALDQAAGQLLSQWQVDDDSSAAEQIAHKAVTDNQGAIKEAVTDPNGFMAKIKGMFSGVSSSAVLPAARLTDLDLIKPDVVAQGVATILAEGLPISRLSDPLAPSGSLILQGSATVLSAGLPTARVTSTTSPPDVLLVKGAPTVLVGGPGAAISPPAPPTPPKSPGNAGPAGPDSPSKPSSGSGGEGGLGGSQTGAAPPNDSSPSSGSPEATPTPPSGTPAPATNQTPSATSPTPCSSQVGVLKDPNGSEIPVYYDPTLSVPGSTAGDLSGVYLGPDAVVPAGTPGAIQAPDGTWLNPCVLAHEGKHVELIVGGNRDYLWQEPQAKLTGAACALDQGNYGYMTNQLAGAGLATAVLVADQADALGATLGLGNRTVLQSGTSAPYSPVCSGQGKTDVLIDLRPPVPQDCPAGWPFVRGTPNCIPPYDPLWGKTA